MESNTPNSTNGAAPKKTAGKLPGKPLSFSNQPGQKNGKKVNISINKSAKSSHLLKKLTGK